MLVLALLPLAALALLIRFFSIRSDRWGEGVVLGAITWGALVVAITELLGFARALSAGVLVLVWLLVSFAIGIAGLRGQGTRERASADPPEDVSRPSGWNLPAFDRLLLVPLAGILLVTLVIAVAAPPNTFDSMTYHMSRVAHWESNRSVANYPTAILRQLHQAPWSEYAILHLQILSGGDRFANLIQWLAMVGSLVAVALIACELGAGTRGMVAAAVFCATLPMGIMQATSTQTDYVVTFWLACVTWLVLSLRRSGLGGMQQWLALGGALGLAALTKATAYIFAAPFVFWLLASYDRLSLKDRLRGLVTAAAVALAINAAFYQRNFALYGSPLGPGHEAEGDSYTNEVFGVGVLASNLVRNLSVHAAGPIGHIPFRTEGIVHRLHGLFGGDASRPETTWLGMEYHVPRAWLHEDSAPNPLHLLLALIAAAIVVTSARHRSRDRVIYVVAIASGFVLFCALLKWQAWHSRLHLALFVLAAPVVGLVMEALRERVRTLTVGLLLIGSLPWLLRNQSRPLLARENVLNTPREEQYFANWAAMRNELVPITARIGEAGCHDVALVLRWNDYEYPIWMLTERDVGRRPLIRHVGVDNPSARLAAAGAAEPPCALIGVRREAATAQAATAMSLRAVRDEGYLSLYLR